MGNALCNAALTGRRRGCIVSPRLPKKNKKMKRAPLVRESSSLPFYAVGCLGVGAAIFIAAGLRDASVGAVTAGIGFAVYAVSTYRDPVVFSRPLLRALERAPSKGPLERGLDLIAIVAIAGGLLVLWCA